MVQVATGDVLLFRGRGFVSRGIRFLDGSEVNHAAIAVDGARLSEATGRGLEISPIAVAVERNERTLVLRATGGDPDAAATRAVAYANSGVPYAYQQIVLLAVLCLTRRIPIGNRWFRIALRRALEAAADLVNSFVDRGADLMICSEYVYRCYRETGLDLLPQGIPDLAAATSPADGVALIEWLSHQPMPITTAATVPFPLDDPATIADRAIADLEADLAAFFADLDGPVTGTASLTASPTDDVTDQEITAAAAHLGRAATTLVRLRDPGAPTTLSLGPADAVAVFRNLFTTNPNFVTPRDLLFTIQLSQQGELA